MPLVAGVDSSTQSCKVLVCDAASGVTVRSGQAGHPDGTEVDPRAWWDALRTAVTAAGGLGDVAAIAIGGQQHGMVCLDERGTVVRPALLWNDTRSAQAAADLVAELAVPTLSDGESYADLLADRSAFEEFDADSTGERGAGFVKLAQLAAEHVLNAR